MGQYLTNLSGLNIPTYLPKKHDQPSRNHLNWIVIE